MTNINLTIGKTLDGTKPYMGIAFVDSYKDILLKELKLEDINPDNPDGDHYDNYFTVCTKCKLPVVDSSIVPDTEGMCNHCCDKAMGVVQPKPETRMEAVLIDSWGDKLIIHMMADTQIEGADYFMPCAHCGNAVLVNSIQKHSDCCFRCETGNYNMAPVTYIKSGVGTGPTREDIDKLLLINKLPEDTMEKTLQTEGSHPGMTTVKSTTTVIVNPDLDFEERLTIAIEAAELAFWDVIARSYPEAVSGDYLMDNISETLEPNVRHWVELNVDHLLKDTPSYRGDKLDLSELHLNYEDTWHLMHMGGGCMVAITDNVAVNMKHYYLAVSGECVCIYEDTFRQDDFMQEHVTEWSFGDNPTVLMNQIDEFMGGTGYWDTGKLFDDIQILAKCNKVTY